MADNSKIEWTEASWNPVTGCTKVSAGCDNCYAERFAERWRGIPGHHFERGFDVTLRPEMLDLPGRWKRPRRIFVNSMSDLFHDDVADSYIAETFVRMARAAQHTFQLLTKRHGRMRSLLNRPSFRDNVRDMAPDAGWPLPNLWLGVSVENQQWADIRVPALLDTPAAVRWLSCEPLLGPVRLADDWWAGLPHRRTWVDWVVVGGESGPHARPMHPDWARSLRDQCAESGVPFFFKQWGEWTPDTTRNWGEGNGRRLHYPRTFVEGCAMDRVGKRNAGRELDGRTWDQYPAVA